MQWFEFASGSNIKDFKSGTLRQEYHEAVLGDKDTDNKPVTPTVTSATWLDTTTEKPII